MGSKETEKIVQDWQRALIRSNESFSGQTRSVSTVDSVVARQRSIISNVQSDLCTLSATQYRLKFQLETLESHQTELEAALVDLEATTQQLLSHPDADVKIEHNDKLFCFAESTSAQIKDVCRKIQEVDGLLDGNKNGHVSSDTLSEYVRVLNRQLSTLKILDNKLTQLH